MIVSKTEEFKCGSCGVGLQLETTVKVGKFVCIYCKKDCRKDQIPNKPWSCPSTFHPKHSEPIPVYKFIPGAIIPDDVLKDMLFKARQARTIEMLKEIDTAGIFAERSKLDGADVAHRLSNFFRARYKISRNDDEN